MKGDYFIIMENKILVKFFGTRGSFYVNSDDMKIYGKDTACVLAKFGEIDIILDFGSGILRIDDAELSTKNHVYGLLSHPHLDHIMGLPTWNKFVENTFNFEIYSTIKNGVSCKEQIHTLFNPILWPVTPDDLPANVTYHDIISDFYIGDIHIEYLSVNHPGGNSAYKLTYKNKSIVYTGDMEYELTDKTAFEQFINGADLLILDSYYTKKDFIIGRGHSTFEDGIYLSKKCNIAKTVFTHHSPKRTDFELDALSEKILSETENCIFAKDLTEIIINL